MEKQAAPDGIRCPRALAVPNSSWRQSSGPPGALLSRMMKPRSRTQRTPSAIKKSALRRPPLPNRSRLRIGGCVPRSPILGVQVLEPLAMSISSSSSWTKQRPNPLFSPQVDIDPRIRPDSAWVLYATFPKAEDAFVSAGQLRRRVPASGGPSQFVLGVHRWAGHRCVRHPAELCVVGQQTED
jgi:hypothetical protein